jgi:hypothetical protein
MQWQSIFSHFLLVRVLLHSRVDKRQATHADPAERLRYNRLQSVARHSRPSQKLGMKFVIANYPVRSGRRDVPRSAGLSWAKSSLLHSGRQLDRMKLAATMARSLPADMRSELRDLEQAAAAGTNKAGRGLRTELRRPAARG